MAHETFNELMHEAIALDEGPVDTVRKGFRKASDWDAGVGVGISPVARAYGSYHAKRGNNDRMSRAVRRRTAKKLGKTNKKLDKAREKGNTKKADRLQKKQAKWKSKAKDQQVDTRRIGDKKYKGGTSDWDETKYSRDSSGKFT